MAISNYKNISYLLFSLCILLLAGFLFYKLTPNLSQENYKTQVTWTNKAINEPPTNPILPTDNQLPETVLPEIVAPQPETAKVQLAVPYINEAPDDNWTGPWKNACEEASISMVEKYYRHRSFVTISEAKDFMNMLFTKQNEIWGSNADADAKRTAQLINDYTVSNATIIIDPTVDQIKAELQQNRPVISLHYGFDLQNPNIPFVPAPRGSSYHMMVIIGYDDTTQEFITNDTGDRIDGPGHRYDYDLFMNTLHDFNFKVRQANGPATVIFTYPKLVKLADDPRVYYLHENSKQYITGQETFIAQGWTWDAVNLVEDDWLNTFINDTNI